MRKFYKINIFYCEVGSISTEWPLVVSEIFLHANVSSIINSLKGK